MPTLLKRLLRRLRKPFGASAKLVIYRHDLEDVALDVPRPFRLNHRPDLEAHRQSERWLDTPTFLHSAHARLNGGEWVYTYAEAGELLAWFWVVPEQTRAYFPSVDQEYRFPLDSYAFYEVYVCPNARGRGLYTAGMRQLLAEMRELGRVRHVYCAVHADNAVPHKVMRALGFHAEACLNFRRRLWKQTKWMDSLSADPESPDSPPMNP
ncbi:MAG: GNAT family N-acetyltransferase [Gammaproteobacteria bacterium]|nr:GNAT family N-acetyltransferase [Gammaproteobacteria bacterium]